MPIDLEQEKMIGAVRKAVDRQILQGRRPRQPVSEGIEIPVTPWQQPTQWQPTEQIPWTPQPMITPEEPITPAPILTTEPPAPVEKPKEEIPFWQRGLQVFAAPFDWIDENIIKPGLSLAGTAAGIVPEVARLPGEDFFEWKKRSWAGWETPGIDINVPWSDKPARIDVRGVLELAPWLLIPGAGQVGGGVRAARGVAGILGKVGKAGRALGYAVEYSPWGLVEKTAGVALKAGIKGVGKVAGGISEKVGERLVGKIPPPPPPPPVVQELTKFFDETVIPARQAFEKELPALRARQAKAVEDIWARVRKGELTATEGTALAEQATAGGIKYKFAVKVTKEGAPVTPEVNIFSAEKIDELLGMMVKSSENGLVTRDSALALQELLLKGGLPEPHNIRDFAKVFGQDFAKSVSKLRGVSRSNLEKWLDILNIPRAALASGDLSGTFRQGLIMVLTRPQDLPRAFWRQLKYFTSEKLSLEMDDALRSHPLYQKATQEWGVDFTPIRKGAELAAKEEPFASNIAQFLPGIRRSERAYTGFLNEMRMSATEAAYHAMKAQGATDAQFKLMGSFINIASGRGTLPANLDKYAPMLNTILFSARYQMSTLQLPRQLGRMLLSKNPYMRKEAAKALVTFIGGGAALLGLLKATGVSKVELDPRSADFGKIKIGETRLDIWRGYLQYARFAAQILTSESKSAYGNINQAKRDQIAWRFLQSKSSPAFGLIVDLLRGEDYMGAPLFEKTTGAIKTARNRFLPIALQDVIDAMEQSGMNGLWTAIPSTLGVGVLTYVNDLVRVKEKIAREMNYQTWDEIDPKTQREIENRNVELQTAYIKFDRQVMGTAWGDWRLAGKAVDDVFRENIDKATAQFRETQNGYQFREKVSDAFTARRGGYDARSKEARFEDIVRRLGTKDTAEALVNLGPEQMAIRIYNESLYGDDMYDEFGDYRFDEAEIRKQQLRTQLDEMFNYVEEYRALKFEDFPAEFQQLAKAKQVMREYWEVRDWWIQRFGEPKTQSALNRMNAFVSRQHTRLRKTNPDIARAYDTFYKKTPVVF